MSVLPYLPTVIATVTNVGTGIYVSTGQPVYPLPFVIFQVAMTGISLLTATPYRSLWSLAFVLLIGGVLLTGFSVGFFYLPTVVVAALVILWRLREATSGNRAS
jgi:hypothetical protein